MAIPEVTSVDYLEEAKGRLTSQFEDKDIVNRYLELLIKEQYEIQSVFTELLQKRSIDSAEGAALDIIGEIVGQPRELLSVDTFEYFGFQGALKAGGFGNYLNPSTGSVFLDYGSPTSGNVLLDDATYRLFIKAKILKNNTTSTPEEFISFINFLFSTESTAIVEGSAEFTVFFGRQLTPIEQVLLNYVSNSQGYQSRLIPKTVGVKINFGIFESGRFFGFQGAPGAKGFGRTEGTYGWGLGYGLNYGESDYTDQGYYVWSQTFDGENAYDGTHDLNPTKTFVPFGPNDPIGGIFATLI